MLTSTVSYEGNLRTTCTHISSGQSMVTDAPVDNEGKGEAFSPTDLMATSLASCMLTIMGIVANNHGFTFEGAQAQVIKTMASNPRRVVKIQIGIEIPDKEYSEKQKALLENGARNCPVAKSIHPDIEVHLSFRYAG